MCRKELACCFNCKEYEVVIVYTCGAYKNVNGHSKFCIPVEDSKTVIAINNSEDKIDVAVCKACLDTNEFYNKQTAKYDSLGNAIGANLACVVISSLITIMEDSPTPHGKIMAAAANVASASVVFALSVKRDGVMKTIENVNSTAIKDN